jgi:hypothetical protein
MQLTASDVEALYTDPANAEAVVSWNGEVPLYAAILDSIFREDRQTEAANLPAKSEDGENLRGRFARQRLAV